MKTLTLTLLGLMFICLDDAGAQTLVGTVHNKRGKPIAGANVIGTGEFAGEGKINGTVTAANGRFALTLDPGANNVIVNYAGYKAVSHKVNVNKGDTLYVDVFMGRSPRHYWDVVDKAGRKVL